MARDGHVFAPLPFSEARLIFLEVNNEHLRISAGGTGIPQIRGQSFRQISDSLHVLVFVSLVAVICR